MLSVPAVAVADVYLAHDDNDTIHLTNITPDAVSTDSASGDSSLRYEVLLTDPVAQPQASAANKNPMDTENRDGLESGMSFNASANSSKGQTRFETVVDEAAKATALPSALLHAVIQVESGYNPNAISPKGARGLMQLMPDTAKQFAVKNPHDPRQNVMAGAQYLKALQLQFNGDIRLALAAYNAGPATVLRYGSRIPPIAETRQYVPRVLGYYQHLSQQRLRRM